MHNRGRVLVIGVIVVIVVTGLVMVLRLALRPSSPSPVAEVAAVDLDTVQAQLDAGEFAAAKEALERFVAVHAEDAEAHFLLGVAHFNLAEYDQARTAFGRAMALDPGRAAAVHHNLGVLAYQLGDMDTAVAEFQAALEADPNDPDTHYQLGAAYLQIASADMDTTLFAQAEEEFQQVLVLSPGKPEALVGLGTLYMSQNRLTEAIPLLEQAVQANPEMREALFALGLAYFSKGDAASAKATLQQFLDTDPPERWAKEAQDILAQISP